MKEEYITDKSKPLPSSKLSKEERTAMSKHIQMIARFCFIYDADLKKLEEHELSVGENISGRVGFGLTEPLYNVRRAINDDHA